MSERRHHLLAKTLLVMRLTMLFLTVSLMQVSARGLSQHVNFEGKDISLSKVLEVVEMQTGMMFLYDRDLLKDAKPVTIRAQQLPVAEFLKLLFKNQPYSFSIIDNTVIVKATPELSVGPIYLPPPITVRGKVLNENGEPIAASVVVKGTKNGTTTDSFGNFAINNVDDNAVLIISGINIESQEIKVGGRSEIIIAAHTKVIEEEIVVKTNYYSTTKRLSTGSISKVTSKEIGNQPVTNPLLSLQGRVAGLEITMPANAVPGAAPTIRIRGNNSLRMYGKGSGLLDDGNYPLYVIDGVPVTSSPMFAVLTKDLSVNGFDPLSTINPANIESIEILKDADATAIYGSRGANGVILITTKNGKKGDERTNVDLSVYKGYGQVSNKLHLLNNEQYLAMRYEALANEQVNVSNHDYDLKYWDQNHYTDWQDALIGGTAQITDLQGTVSYGNKNTSFRIGGGFHKETLVFPGSFGYSRASMHLSSLHSSSNQRFKMSIAANYGVDNHNLFGGDAMQSALTLPPNAPKIYKEDGTLNWELHAPDGYILNTWENPLASLLNKQKNETRTLVASGNLTYDIFPGLSLMTNLGYSDAVGTKRETNTIASHAPTDFTLSTGGAGFYNNNRSTWIIEPKMSYSKKFGVHSVDVMVGASWQNSKANDNIISGSEYPSDALLNSLVGAGKIEVLWDQVSEYRYVSGYGRVAYNWKQKYLINITGRRDGSSRFGPNKRFGNFGAVGMGWIFSEEQFIQQTLPFLTFGKLLGSYGVTGSDPAQDYKYYNLYNILSNRYNGVRGIDPAALYNPDFAWGSTKKLELSIELAFLKNRLGMQVNWYRNQSLDQLIEYQLPATTGFPFVLTNFDAVVQNNGWEIVLRAEPVTSKTWKWNTSFNVSLPRNKLVRFDGIEVSPYFNKYKVGEPLSIQWLYTWIGVNSQTGLHEIVDENKDGVINDLDKKLLNSTDRKYYGGMNNTVQYRNIELSIQFQFSNQDASRYRPGMPGRKGVNQSIEVLNRWFTNGDQTGIQRFTPDNYAGREHVRVAVDRYLYAGQSNYNSENASFIRLKSLSLNYMITPQWLKQTGLQQATFFIQGQNLLTITNYSGLDPETGSGLPPLRMYTAGIQVRL